MGRIHLPRLVVIPVLMLLFILPACYPGGPQDLGEIGVVLT